MSEQDKGQEIESWGRQNVQGWDKMTDSQKRSLYEFDASTTRRFRRQEELNEGVVRARGDVKENLRAARRFLAFAVGAVIAYPTTLGITDHLLPSGNVALDIGKYALEFGLAGIASGAIAAERNRRRQLDAARSELHDARRRAEKTKFLLLSSFSPILFL